MRKRTIRARDNSKDSGETEIDCFEIENIDEAMDWINRMTHEELIKFVNKMIAYQALWAFHKSKPRRT